MVGRNVRRRKSTESGNTRPSRWINQQTGLRLPKAFHNDGSRQDHSTLRQTHYAPTVFAAHADGRFPDCRSKVLLSKGVTHVCTTAPGDEGGDRHHEQPRRSGKRPRRRRPDPAVPTLSPPPHPPRHDKREPGLSFQDDTAQLPRSARTGPVVVGRTSKSKMAVGKYSEQHALGMSTTPLTRPSIGAAPSNK
jgi:hypothetical protein